MGILDKAIKGVGIVGALAAANEAIKKTAEVQRKSLNEAVDEFLDKNPRGTILQLETFYENKGLDLLVTDLTGREMYSVKGSIGNSLNRHMKILQYEQKVAELNADIKLFKSPFDKNGEKPVSINIYIGDKYIGKVKTINASGVNTKYGPDFMDAVVQTNVFNKGFRLFDNQNHEYLKVEVKGTSGKYYTLMIDNEKNELLMLAIAVAVIMIQTIQAQ